MIKIEQLNGKGRVAVNSICDVAGILPVLQWTSFVDGENFSRSRDYADISKY